MHQEGQVGSRQKPSGFLSSRDFKGNESNEQLIQSPPSNPVVGNGIVVVEEKSELKEPWEKDPRLPRHLIPLHYDLYLHPNLNTGLFTGNRLNSKRFLDVTVRD